MAGIDILFVIIILIGSVVIHELAHGYSANVLGDPTAKYAGRLSFNPIKHLDPLGSIIVPLALALLPGNVIFGWAKPVPYNPYNLRNQRWGEAIVAAAGPLSNILIALVFGVLIRAGITPGVIEGGFSFASFVVLINIVLAIFNLVPIPPLDGSKILFSILPHRFYHFRDSLERFGLVLVVFFIFFLWQFVYPIVISIFSLVTGIGFS